MPSIYDLKPGFQDLLRPVATALSRNRVRPNAITVLALLLSLAMGAAIALAWSSRWPLLLLGLMLIVRMALNALDGILAREHNMKSALGGLLNELGDVISDTALYLPLALVPGFNPSLVVLNVVLAIIAEMAGVLGIQVRSVRSYRGPMGKSDRAFVFGLLSLLVGAGIPPGGWLTAALAAVLLLHIGTIYNRCREALKGAASL
jgi:CDP-diacylglycerol--glycerol-3-phosphate 3-phosphatidyltransferase